MKNSASWEAVSSLAGQEIYRFLWNPKIHLPLDHVLSQMIPDLIFTPYFFSI
jgi:hypothetical protein